MSEAVRKRICDSADELAAAVDQDDSSAGLRAAVTLLGIALCDLNRIADALEASRPPPATVDLRTI